MGFLDPLLDSNENLFGIRCSAAPPMNRWPACSLLAREREAAYEQSFHSWASSGATTTRACLTLFVVVLVPRSTNRVVHPHVHVHVCGKRRSCYLRSCAICTCVCGICGSATPNPKKTKSLRPVLWCLMGCSTYAHAHHGHVELTCTCVGHRHSHNESHRHRKIDTYGLRQSVLVCCMAVWP